jgi:DNA-directed RNA polymerase, mitochondrial
MSTLEERQVALEIESVVLGRQRYEDRRQAEGESATRAGAVQVKRALPAVADALVAFAVEATSGKAGRKHTAIKYLAKVEPDEAAYLALRYALDGAAFGEKAQTVAIRIGSALQDHVNLMSMAAGDEREDDAERKRMKRLFRKVLEQVKTSTSERHRTGVWRHVLAKYAKTAVTWADTDKLHVGLKLLELVQDSTGLVQLERRTNRKNDTPVYLVFTPEAAEWFANAHMTASLWEPVHQPMLVPPRRWTGPTTGGYLSDAIRAKLVTTSVPGFIDELRNVEMPRVLDALNAVQETGWRINRTVLDTMGAVWAMPGFKHLFATPADPAPVRPAGVPDGVALEDLPLEQREAMLVWKQTRARHMEAKAREESSTAVAAQRVGLARKFAAEDRFYFPHFLDFRGRMYPFCATLSPQGDDASRGLLQFAEGKPLGERGGFWLKVHLANVFGVDKVSYAERVQWVEEHHDVLVACAVDPLAHTFWTEADGGNNPWQALAACCEYAGYAVAGEDFVSHLAIGMDGSCSGLQHYSAMLRDSEGARQVNLMPAEKPGDIYTAVAKKAQAVVDLSTDEAAAPWAGNIRRLIAKQPTMTYCYSASQYGMAGQIEVAVRKLGGGDYLSVEDHDVRRHAVYLAGIVRAAIGETVVAAKTAMDFLQGVARLAAEHDLPIRWHAPSGFPVVQAYRKVVGSRIEVMYQGVRLDLTVATEGAAIDKKRQANGVAPNFVHACDSSHLMATVLLGQENGLSSWACVHDSFGCHAADVDVLHACIRTAFVEQYTPDVLSAFRQEIAEQLPPELVEQLPEVPAMGDLELSAVLDAQYFFA